MKISIFGLGYVGLVNAVCLAQEGHEIIGVDVNPQKVRMVNEGISPITEDKVEAILKVQVTQGRLMATDQTEHAVAHSDMCLICVGTPSTVHGTLDLTQVEHVCRQIGDYLTHLDKPYTVVMRSTMLPGSCQRMAELLADVSGRTLGQDLHIAFNPEFLREGTAVDDFYAPPYTVVGTAHPRAVAMLEDIYGFLATPLEQVGLAEAEMLKYACNAFHATKITFANEIGRVARELNVDGIKVMELLCQDTVLNISPAYLRPGFAYGGSCLPKDLRALVGRARLQNAHVPLLESLAWSNRMQIEQAYEIIAQAVHSKEETIGFLGLSFKAGTDDLRESPMVELVERFIGKGYRLLLYDKYVSLTRLMGTNKQYIQQEIPHLSQLMSTDVAHVLSMSKVLVVVNRNGPYVEALAQADASTRIICLEDTLSGYTRMPSV
jgi:GDP-mannose 6-dehydrogenase